MMVRCSNCGAPLTGCVCEYCGARDSSAWNTAQGGTRNNAAFEYQSSRTENFTARRTEAKTGLKNKWVAFFLCLFLGWLGIHRLYVGKIGSGLLFMVTKGLGGVGVVFDLIMILTDNFTDAEGRRLTTAFAGQTV